MENTLKKNDDGSIDIFDDYGFIKYRVESDETGIIAILANQLERYERLFEKKLKNILMEYFDIDNDTYAYNLTRDKTTFNVGTMSLDDFEEFTEDTIDDIVDYIKSNL